MRERSDIEHAKALFQFLAGQGSLHTHVTEQEFCDVYITMRVDDEAVEEKPLGEILTTFEGFAKTRPSATIVSTFTSDADRANAKSRKQRHEEILARWRPQWGK